MKNIYFDMDGTIAALYGVPNWLDYLHAEDVFPYAKAEPLVNMQVLARLLNRLTAQGCTVNIISWGCRGASAEYDKAVTEVKIKWLKKHLASVHFSSIQVLPYGTPKEEHGNGILFDDEEKNRLAWNGEAYTEKEIFTILKQKVTEM